MMNMLEWIAQKLWQRRERAIIAGVLRATEFPGPDHQPVPMPPLGKIIIFPVQGSKNATEAER